MGATTFQEVRAGQTRTRNGHTTSAIDAAFVRAIDEARHEYGHREYTGTIAEKDGYLLVTDSPVRDAFKAMQMIADADDYLNNIDPRDGKKALHRIPKQHRDWAIRWARTFGDKWGPAVAIEIKGAKAKEIKEAQGYKGKAKVKVYIFAGWASC